MTVKPVEGKYPDWRRVIKVDKKSVNDCWVFLHPKYMMDAARAISLLRSGSKTKVIDFALEEVTTVSSRNAVLFTHSDSGFIALIMPFRGNAGGVEYRMPEWIGGE